MTDSGFGAFLLIAFICFLLLGVRTCGVGMLTSTEINNIKTVSEKLCENNDGVLKVDFFPSSSYEIDITCMNKAIFKDVDYRLNNE
jgi:hypothetical protein